MKATFLGSFSPRCVQEMRPRPRLAHPLLCLLTFARPHVFACQHQGRLATDLPTSRPPWLVTAAFASSRDIDSNTPLIRQSLPLGHCPAAHLPPPPFEDPQNQSVKDIHKGVILKLTHHTVRHNGSNFLQRDQRFFVGRLEGIDILEKRTKCDLTPCRMPKPYNTRSNGTVCSLQGLKAGCLRTFEPCVPGKQIHFCQIVESATSRSIRRPPTGHRFFPKSIDVHRLAPNEVIDASANLGRTNAVFGQ